jgi:hypothetical protein
MASSTWYMSFTFPNPPSGFDSTIYLAFTTTNDNFGNYTVQDWYNINPPETCSINTESKIYSSPAGFFSGNYPNDGPVSVIFTTIPGLTISSPPSGYTTINGISALGSIQLDSGQNQLIHSPNASTENLYPGTYTFSKNTPIACCFSEGTRILGLTAQLKEEYRLVQDLLIGDFIKSYLHGYRKVSKILKGSFVNNPTEHGVANCMYRMSKTEDNGLIEDLTLTRNHGVLVEKLTEDEEKKVDKNNLPVIDGLLSIITSDSDKFEKVKDTNVYNYYHFSLDGDGDNDRRFGVYANGLLVETPSNNMMDGAMNIKPLDF